MDRPAFLRTMRILEARHPFEDWSRSMTSFEVLVSTILSQSTTVSNERRGMDGLLARFGSVTPEILAAAHADDIAKAIWHSGLARQKAPRIQAVAREVVQAWGGKIEDLLALPTERAREALMALPGVGPKTADVVLAFAAERPVFPVDTHIARIARRWRLVRRGGYETTRAALERWTPAAKRMAWHMAIIAHGRERCTARNPRCDACPVARDCDWYRGRRARARLHGKRHGPPRPQQQKVKNR